MMNELPRINTHSVMVYKTQTNVTPTTHIAGAPLKVEEHERRKMTDRRRQKNSPIVERRVSSDRRSPRFDAKA